MFFGVINIFYKLAKKILKQFIIKLIFLFQIIFELILYIFFNNYIFNENLILKNEIDINQNFISKIKMHLRNSYIYYEYGCKYRHKKNFLLFNICEINFKTTPLVYFFLNLFFIENICYEIQKNSFYNFFIKKKIFLTKYFLKYINLKNTIDGIEIKEVLSHFEKCTDKKLKKISNYEFYKILKFEKDITQNLTKNKKNIKLLKSKNKKYFYYNFYEKKNNFKKVLVKLNNDFFHKQENNKYFFISNFNTELNLLENLIDFIYKISNDVSLFRSKNHNFIMMKYKKKKYFKNVIFASSSACENYFHYLFEIIIPTYYYFILNKKKLKVLLPNVFPKFSYFLKKIFNKKIILINDYENTYLECENSISANFVNIFENHYPELNYNNAIKNRFYINKKAMQIFRLVAQKYKKKQSLKSPFVALIDRHSESKKAMNLKKLFLMFFYSKNIKKNNYTAIFDPARHNIVDQISFYSWQRRLIIPMGSGLTNIIFCKPKTKVYVTCPNYKYNFYDFWSIIAKYLNIKLYYIPQKNILNKKFFTMRHANYFVQNLNFLNYKY